MRKRVYIKSHKKSSHKQVTLEAKLLFATAVLGFISGLIMLATAIINALN